MYLPDVIWNKTEKKTNFKNVVHVVCPIYKLVTAAYSKLFSIATAWKKKQIGKTYKMNCLVDFLPASGGEGDQLS